MRILERGARCFDMEYKPQSLVDILRNRALAEPQRVAYTYLVDGDGDEIKIAYGELDRQARAIAASLQALGLSGERALLLYPPGLEFVAAFFGCLYAGVVAVPANPPRRNQKLARLLAISANSQAKAALTTASIKRGVEPYLSEEESLRELCWLQTDSLVVNHCWQNPAVDHDSLAFIQYTSGSTGTPRGVMVTHGNLLHNSSLLLRSFKYNADSYCVSWLPMFHDMGLIGAMLQPLYGGYPCTLMSPASFLQSPFRWLQAISERKATISGGPNFAYDLCVRKISDEQRATLDLSSWLVSFVGSEPIRAETLERFSERFAPCGFRREAFLPCYGLAEATLLVSGRMKPSPPVV